LRGGIGALAIFRCACSFKGIPVDLQRDNFRFGDDGDFSLPSSKSSADALVIRSPPLTPMLVVTGKSVPGFACSTATLIRSAVAWASPVEKSGRETANSSPSQR